MTPPPLPMRSAQRMGSAQPKWPGRRSCGPRGRRSPWGRHYPQGRRSLRGWRGHAIAAAHELVAGREVRAAAAMDAACAAREILRPEQLTTHEASNPRARRNP